MRHPKQKPAAAAKSPYARVQLEFTDPNARMVCVAGTFNEWNQEAIQMVPMGAGRWWKELMLPPGEHQYRFVVDGVWVDDPAAKEYSDNGVGSRNAIIRVAAVT